MAVVSGLRKSNMIVEYFDDKGKLKSMILSNIRVDVTPQDLIDVSNAINSLVTKGFIAQGRVDYNFVGEE